MSDQGDPAGPQYGQQPGEGQQPPPYQPPQQPDYGQPQQPYQPPQQPDYGQPQQPYQPPQQPDYGQPQQPYQPPQQPDYGQPQQPYQPPQQPDYGQPPQYGQQPGYGQQPPAGYGTAPYGAPPTPPIGGYAPGGGGSGSHKGQWATVIVVVLLALGVGAYFLFSGGSASASTPKAAVQKLLDAGKTNDLNAAKKVLCSADVPNAGELRDSGRITGYHITSVTQHGNNAVVAGTITTTETKTAVPVSLPVQKENGSWKVCPSDLLGGSQGASGASTVPSLPATSGLPSLPSGLPSLPSGLPSIPLPSISIPGNLGGVNPCGFISDASTAAIAYVGAAEIGETSVAQGCVYKNDVPASVTDSIKSTGSTTLYSPVATGNGPTFGFVSIDGKSHLAVTMTKESDGKYYVTKVVKS